MEAEAYRRWDAEDFSTAAEFFARAYKLKPDWLLLWNRARALESARDLPGAYTAFRLVSLHDGVPAPKAAEARAKLSDLESHLSTTLALTCVPADATFVGWGPAGSIEGRCPWRQQGLRPGVYTVQVTAPGFGPASIEVEIAPGADEVRKVELQHVLGTLVITSSLSGGLVTVGGTERGRTPEVKLELPAGTHDVQVDFPGRGLWTSTVGVPAGERITVQAEPPSGGQGEATLALDVKPDGTRVIIDGEPVGETPLSPIPVTPGSRRIVLKAPNHAPFVHRLEVAAGTRTPIVVRLQPLPASVLQPAPTDDTEATALLRQSEPRGPRVARWIGWGAVGLAAATGVLAGVWWADAGQLSEDADTAYADYAKTHDAQHRTQAQELDADWEDTRGRAVWATVGAGALLAVGGGLVVWDAVRGGGGERAALVVPVVVPGGAVVMVGGGF